MVKKTIAKNIVSPKKNIESLPGMSLSKYIALSGVCSRRKATELIEQGHVLVNNKVITAPGFKVAENAQVKAQGKIVAPEAKVYVLLNKPKDYIATVSDEKGRKTVMQLVDIPQKVRLYPIGRLDRATTGLLVLTNDGDFAQQLSHPKYEISKTYHVTLNKILTNDIFRKIGSQGVELEDGHVQVDGIGFITGFPKTELVIEIHSGKNRVVRRIFESFDYDVKKLDRIEYAGLTKHGLRNGQWRYLSQGEVNRLKKTTEKK